jgi:hypothetical protein
MTRRNNLPQRRLQRIDSQRFSGRQLPDLSRNDLAPTECAEREKSVGLRRPGDGVRAEWVAACVATGPRT